MFTKKFIITNLIILCTHRISSSDVYFAMFFLDNSLYGSSSLGNQVGIVNQFVLNKPNDNDVMSLTILSQGKTSFNTSFHPMLINDYGNFYNNLATIMSQEHAIGNISYFQLTSDVAAKSSFYNTKIYTQKPIIVYFIDSYLNRIEDTRKILNMINKFYGTEIKVLSIIFDETKTSAATFLTKNKDFVNINVDSKETVKWLYKQYQNSQ
uniref:VWFA domain-containing protein n=1 Tax=Strongyloides venezuelensis TaxID=75913 RepID=A0A0K0G4X2_STRVS